MFAANKVTPHVLSGLSDTVVKTDRSCPSNLLFRVAELAGFPQSAIRPKLCFWLCAGLSMFAFFFSESTQSRKRSMHVIYQMAWDLLWVYMYLKRSFFSYD